MYIYISKNNEKNNSLTKLLTMSKILNKKIQ